MNKITILVFVLTGLLFTRTGVEAQDSRMPPRDCNFFLFETMYLQTEQIQKFRCEYYQRRWYIASGTEIIFSATGTMAEGSAAYWQLGIYQEWDEDQICTTYEGETYCTVRVFPQEDEIFVVLPNQGG